jgi:hypothetical protein
MYVSVGNWEDSLSLGYEITVVIGELRYRNSGQEIYLGHWRGLDEMHGGFRVNWNVSAIVARQGCCY